MFYHGSPEGGIKVLEPKVSMHSEAYVYLCINKAHAALYMAKSFMYPYGFKNRIQLRLNEPYEGYLEETYSGKSGYLYKVTDVKSFNPLARVPYAYVTKESVNVDSFEYYEDVYEALLDLESQHRLILRRYPEKVTKDWYHKYFKRILLEDNYMDSEEPYALWIKEKFPQALEEAMEERMLENQGAV